MAVIRFLFREGSPFIFSALIVLFALNTGPFGLIPANTMGMFGVFMVVLAYLAIQMGMVAFSRVGMDGPLLDMFLSLAPMVTLIVLAVLAIAGKLPLSTFQQLGLWFAAMVVAMDLIFNTLVLFKMNRLANDFVPMR